MSSEIRDVYQVIALQAWGCTKVTPFRSLIPMLATESKWAIVSSNCSIPGAYAAPIAWHESEESARKDLSQRDASCWVEKIPSTAQYVDEVTEQWVHG